MVDSGEYLWQCLKYVELNIVRCGVVDHPRQWEWSGYGELMGARKRNRLLDVDKLLWLVRCGSLAEFREHWDTALEQALVSDQRERQAKWTQSIAVGERAFVEAIRGEIRSRQQMLAAPEGGTWVLREEYGAVFGSKNGAMNLYQAAFLP